MNQIPAERMALFIVKFGAIKEDARNRIKERISQQKLEEMIRDKLSASSGTGKQTNLFLASLIADAFTNHQIASLSN